MNRTLILINIFLISAVAVVLAQRKNGDCPSSDNLSVCGFTCRRDTDCSGDEKCCRTSCPGSICVPPLIPKEYPKIQEKSGSCPESPSGAWVCSSRCSSDNDCRGSHKCCKNRCGALACVKPE